MESNPHGGFLIHKKTMIKENKAKIEEIYKMTKKSIGTGAYGVVSKCVHKQNNQTRACKTVSKKKIKNMEKFKLEI